MTSGECFTFEALITNGMLAFDTSDNLFLSGFRSGYSFNYVMKIKLSPVGRVFKRLITYSSAVVPTASFNHVIIIGSGATQR